MKNKAILSLMMALVLTVSLVFPVGNPESTHQMTIHQFNKVCAAPKTPPPAAKPILPPKLTPEQEFLQIERNLSIHNRQVASRGKLPQNYSTLDKPLYLEDCEKLYCAGTFQISFYTPCKQECGSDRGITASGKPVTPGYSVAADTRVFPIGTLLYIQDWGIVEVMDRGGSVKGGKIDICIFDRQTALNFGRLRKEVWVVCVKEPQTQSLESETSQPNK